MGFDLSEPLIMPSECTETLPFGGNHTLTNGFYIMVTVDALKNKKDIELMKAS